jgi:hypothetical protein
MSHTAVCYDFHGVPLLIQSEDPRIPKFLSSRLRYFSTREADPRGVRFEYRNGGPGHANPPAHARSVYDAPVGTVLYDDASDRLFIDYEDTIGSVADLRAGLVTTVLRNASVEACWLASHPFFTLTLLEQMKRQRLFGVHAALLARNGRAVIIPGTSGAGKSTLTLCLLRAGFEFGGDDLCFITPDDDVMRVFSFPDEIDVAEKTVEFFPELGFLRGTQRRPGAAKWPLLPEQVYPIRFVNECAPSVLVFPHIADSEESRLEPIRSADALLELVPNVLLTDADASQAHLDALGQLIRLSQCWRLSTGRDFDRIPGMLNRLLQPDQPPTTGNGDATPSRDSVLR